jgi:hypothetical protein
MQFGAYKTNLSNGFEVSTALLAICFSLASCLAYSWTLKIEVTCSSEMSVDFQRTTMRYILEVRNLLNSNVFSDSELPTQCLSVALLLGIVSLFGNFII